MKSLGNKKISLSIGSLGLIVLIVTHLTLYLVFDFNIFKEVFGSFYFEQCCVKSVYFDQEYYGKIEKIESARGTTRVKFIEMDSVYLLNRYVLGENKEKRKELVNFVKSGMRFYKPQFDSTLYIENRFGDTLKFTYTLEPYRGKGRLILGKTYLKDITKLSGGK